jgi:sugar-specific transcriptional regulator TrmB
MSKEKIIHNLESFGLTEPEARVYYSVLSLEDAPVDKIARHADTNRTSTYPILERLEAMGIVSRLKKKGKIVFIAASPNKFIDILEERTEKIKEVLPDLKSLFSIQEGRPSVQLFSGTEGLKTVLNGILEEATTELLVFSDGESFLKRIPGWTDEYLKKREKKKIKTRLVVTATKYNIQAAKEAHIEKSNTKIRLLPDAYDIAYSGFDIYNKKVIFYSFDKQNVAVVIESKIINKLMKTVFEILWNEAGKYEGKLN